MTTNSLFDERDREQLGEREIPEAEAVRQMEQLAHPPRCVTLERACTLGDGIARLGADHVDALLAQHAALAAAGRVTSFVPASGAATRMFKELLACRAWPGPLLPAEVGARGDTEAAFLSTFVSGLPRFGFHDALAAALSSRGLDLDALRAAGPWRPLLDVLLDAEGLDYARRPKGLLLFHREPDSIRTPFEEHLDEARELTGDASGVRRLHFTVSNDHLADFEQLLAARRPALESRHGGRWEVEFSTQHPSTDTLAALPQGGPFRDARSRLVFRPSGHGALLRNLAESGADLAFLKNIDNVCVERLREPTRRWSRALVALAAELSARAHALLARLEDPADTDAPSAATRFLAEPLGIAVAEGVTRTELAALLDRPLRACGMVENTGEPGGGPFWVRDADGRITRQIVEAAQVDARSAAQQQILARATHFNPVYLACALRDRHGRVHDLERFVDPQAAIVTRKSHGDRELLALERPGLWNGAMANWHTVFVEVPLAVFTPVKSVLDLLRPEHQPA